ncbi:MAG: aminoacetone oxidase family FAD-binding enzyme [Candidatus Coproplasma sp.]
MKKCDVAIVGGGAAGLACAVVLKRNNPDISVILIDACERLGKKLAATGNGQGNVSNADLSVNNYHGGGVRLAQKICCSDYKKPLSLFNCLFEEDGEGRVYPSGRQASALTDSLVREITARGVEVLKPVKVTKITKGFTLTLSDSDRISAKYVVLACGGAAQKQFGTDGTSFALAKSFGHNITGLYPSLVQLKTDTQYIKTLKGIRANCRVSAYSSGDLLATSCGDVIFTDYGVSGNAIFKISAYVADRQNVTLSLCFLPDIPREEIERDVKTKVKAGYPESELLSGTLHNQLGRAIIRRSGADPAAIAQTVKDFKLKVTGTLGFDYAQVTKGGVKADGIGNDLQSKLCPNLYFAGEYIDVDGDCGGYNLNWALTSGMYVAENIISSYYD